MISTAPSRRPAPWWRLPFTADPWRRTAYVLLAPLTSLIALADGGRLCRRLAAGLLGRRVRATRPRALLDLPVGLLALLVTGYLWLLVVLNLGYPLRPVLGMDGSLDNAWGGPTMAGAWAVHAGAGGLPALFLAPWILRGLNALHLWTLGRYDR